MNIENLNKLIAHLEAQPPERINMAWFEVVENRHCGTAGCIGGHIALMNGRLSSRKTSYGEIVDYLDINVDESQDLAYPANYNDDFGGVRRYPAHRVIATLKRLRDTYLFTGQVVVDWGPEPGDDPKAAWTAPKVAEIAEVITFALPAEITSLLRNTAEA